MGHHESRDGRYGRRRWRRRTARTARTARIKHARRKSIARMRDSGIEWDCDTGLYGEYLAKLE